MNGLTETVEGQRGLGYMTSDGMDRHSMRVYTCVYVIGVGARQGWAGLGWEERGHEGWTNGEWICGHGVFRVHFPNFTMHITVRFSVGGFCSDMFETERLSGNLCAVVHFHRA